MKKILSFGLIFVLAFSLIACGKKDVKEEEVATDEAVVDDVINEQNEDETKEDASSQATFSDATATLVEVDGEKFYIDNPTQNDSEYFFTKVKFVPKEKEVKEVKFDLIALYEGTYLATFEVKEKFADIRDEYIIKVKEEFENILPADELEKIDFTKLEFDIENLEVK